MFIFNNPGLVFAALAVATILVGYSAMELYRFAYSLSGDTKADPLYHQVKNIRFLANVLWGASIILLGLTGGYSLTAANNDKLTPTALFGFIGIVLIIGAVVLAIAFFGIYRLQKSNEPTKRVGRGPTA
jgi:multisubunit Na+/H+ antiporter MnhB subunit